MSEQLRTREDDTGWFEKMGAFMLGVIGILKNALIGDSEEIKKKK